VLALFRLKEAPQDSTMPRKQLTADSLSQLLDQSSRLIYAIDAERRIVYCNPALAAWLDLRAQKIVGRLVEFHSESDTNAEDGDPPLTDLCPPPQAFVGEPCTGTISCLARDGRLVHRRASFVPIGVSSAGRSARDGQPGAAPPNGVLALAAEQDLSPHELAAEISGDPQADDLHRTIRRFRRAQASRYSIESLLGDSSAMAKVRAQVAAAAASGANVLICGQPGSGRGHVARAIHYEASTGDTAKLVPLDCKLLTEDNLRRAMDALRTAAGVALQQHTLLLENLDHAPAALQSQLMACVRRDPQRVRVIATCGIAAPEIKASSGDPGENGDKATADEPDEETNAEPGQLDRALLDAISTITIRLPGLADRLEDLPLVAQFFLEECNHGSSKQVGSLRHDTLDLLALYSWPGELDQLRAVIVAAHRACESHEIMPVDLPPLIHHASRAATHIRRQPEKIVLDELLAVIEKEAIVRALAQSGGNKSEAAGLLGMTRPRLYRRLVQLGLAGVEAIDSDQPEFLESEGGD
jgi:DNA-binding NtrC family response regulator